MLREQPEPLTLAAIARATGLHPNTVREHLANLVRHGLARRSRARPRGRGRPAWLYDQPVDPRPGPEYAGLAATLASAIARNSEAPERDATIAGEEWGHELARSLGHSPEPVTPAEAHARIVTMFEDLGFAPEIDPDAAEQVRLTRCPLLQAAHRHPDVVCAVHLGFVRGALEEYAADPAGTRLLPFSEPGACRLILPTLPAR
jgi:predicted ArsR family transcriptional regulator